MRFCSNLRLTHLSHIYIHIPSVDIHILFLMQIFTETISSPKQTLLS